MAKRKKRRTRSLPAPERYRPPTMEETIRSDSQMTAADIVRKHPSVKAAQKRIAKQLEKQALNLARTGVKLPRQLK